MRSRPESSMVSPRFDLGPVEFVMPIELGIAPSASIANLLEIDEAIPEIDSPDLALVAVDVDDVHANRRPEHFAREIFLRLIAERLSFFGRVDPEEADAMLPVILVENGERIAIRNGNDSAHHDRARTG
jgi:hypothetical protein